MAAGWIYILTNDAFPHLVKIGKTTTSPEQRARELNATGVPDDFKVAFSALSPDVDRHEAETHEALAPHRYRSNREFFAVELETATETLRRICGVGDVEGTIALKVELDLARGEAIRWRRKCGQLEEETRSLRQMLDGANDRVEQLLGRARDDMQHKLAEHRRAIIDEAVSREEVLRAQVEALGREAATLRALLADAVRGTEESP